MSATENQNYQVSHSGIPHSSSSQPSAAALAGRARVSLGVLAVALLGSLAAGLLLRALAAGPTAERPAQDGEPAADAAAGSAEPAAAGHVHADAPDGGHADASSAAEAQGVAAPAGLTALNNPNCPVMGGAVDPTVGIAYNGWWVSFCCPGCDEAFLAEPDAYAAELLAATGRDIRQTPAAAAAERTTRSGASRSTTMTLQ